MDNLYVTGKRKKVPSNLNSQSMFLCGNESIAVSGEQKMPSAGTVQGLQSVLCDLLRVIFNQEASMWT